MYFAQNYTIAVILCVITMFCWGSWANTQKIAGKSWRFELFYWDYVLGILLCSLVLSFTLGSNGNEGRSFIADIKQAETENLWLPFIGGIIFNLSNILLVAGIAIAGMAVAFPVGVGVAMVLGVIINFVTAPKGDAIILFSGVALVVIAIVFDALAYRKMSSNAGKLSSKGIVVALLAGVLMSVFYRFITMAMITDFANPETGKLTPYTAVFFFALGILASNFIINTYLMRKPIEGAPVSISEYFKGNIKVHIAGILGGAIWCIGTSLNIVASGSAGAAISYGLGQGATLIAALWGVFIWKEFKGAGKSVNVLIALMFLFFILGITLIIVAGL